MYIVLFYSVIHLTMTVKIHFNMPKKLLHFLRVLPLY